MKIVHAVCPHDCPDSCSMLVTVVNGRAEKIRGNPDHPITQGFLCAKVNNYLQWTYNPNRVLYPRRRVGPKGSGNWERITWDEAIAAIAERFREIVAVHGPQAILPYSYSGTLGLLNFVSMDRRFFYRLGATLLNRTICSTAGSVAHKFTLGRAGGTDPEAFSRAKLIVVWGSNPVTSHVHLVPFLNEAQKQGAHLVVIDPRRTRTARRADRFLQPRPGTDAALALGMMHVIIEENLYDADYVRQHTIGFDALRERAQDFPPLRAAAITGLDADEIIDLARMYAATRPAVIRVNYGLQRHTNGGMMIRTIACLPALTGAWRDVGGGFLLSTGAEFPVNIDALKRKDLLQGNPRTINMIKLGEALLTAHDPPLKGLFVYNSDPANSAPDQTRVLRGLARDDLFTVVADPFFTDTARYADILLPATTQLERLDLHTSYGHYYVGLNRPAIAPLGESLPNTEIFRRLAQAMDFTEPCFGDSDEALIDQALDSDDPRLAGITRERLMRDGWARLNLPEYPHRPFVDGHFPTPSGRVELYSERMARQGYDPLPDHHPLVEGHETDTDTLRRFPLQLITPSAHHLLNSSFGAVETLVRKEGRPTLEIHPHDAAVRGIADGDLVRVWNERGTCQLYARVTDDVRPCVVASPSVWWASKSPGNRSANATTANREADMGDGATFYTNLVQVERNP